MHARLKEGKPVCPKRLPVFCLSLLLLASLAAAQTRTLNFPSDRSLGKLMKLDGHRGYDFEHMWFLGYVPGDALAEAKGDVAVSEGVRLALDVSTEGWRDLSPLAGLKSGSIEAVLVYFSRTQAEGGDTALAAVSKIAGLKTLCLRGAGVTSVGLAQLASTDSLERLAVGQEELDDAALESIARIRNLRALSVGPCKLVSAEGLSRLGALPYLEELHVSWLQPGAYASLKQLGSVRDLYLGGWHHGIEGVAQLAGMPALRSLKIYDLSDEEFAALPAIPSLESLDITGRGYEYTAAGYAGLSRFPSLETLAIHGGSKKDEAFMALPRIPSLKVLQLSGAMVNDMDFLTDVSLAHISTLNSLETLELYKGRFTDEGIKYLSRLSNLKKLSIPSPDLMTDAGLACIAKLSRLEDLYIRGTNLTDAGMAELEKLPSLRHFQLFCRDEGEISDAALLHLEAAIPGLEIETSAGKPWKSSR